MPTRMVIREKHATMHSGFHTYSFWYFSVCGAPQDLDLLLSNLCDFIVPQPEATFKGLLLQTPSSENRSAVKESGPWLGLLCRWKAPTSIQTSERRWMARGLITSEILAHERWTDCGGASLNGSQRPPPLVSHSLTNRCTCRCYYTAHGGHFPHPSPRVFAFS